MGNNKRKLKALDILATVLFVLAIAIFLLCLIQKDLIIIYLGIQFYQLELIVTSIALASTGFFFVYRLIQFIRNKNKDIEAEAGRVETNRPKARLSVKGDMDPSVVRQLLEKHGLSRWSMYYEQISEISDQMRQMDTYQERLNNLLVNNGADTLSDTEDVLGQVEQYLCRNVRNVVNFMDVADDDAAAEVQQKLTICESSNKDLLKQTRDFVYALAEYLNDQGGTIDTRILDTYRNTILNSIKEGVL